MKTSKGIASRSVITAAVAGAVVLGAIYYMMQQNKPLLSTEEMKTQDQARVETSKRTETKTTTATQPTQSTETVTPAAPGAPMKIFADARVSYAFKYPTNYSVKTYDFGINDDELCFVTSTSQGITSCSMLFRTSPTATLSAKKVIDGMLEMNDAYATEAKTTGQAPTHKYRVEDTSVAGVDAKAIIDTPRTGLEILVKIVLEHNGGTYVFSSGAVLDSGDHQELAAILSTVQFIK